MSPKTKKVHESHGDKDVKIAALTDQLHRSVADYRNLEKRIEEEKKEYVKYANKDLIVKLVPAFDTLFLAGKYTTDESVKLTIKTIVEALKDLGVDIIEAEGKDFDPNTMEAVTTETGEEGKVLEELRPGFSINGKLIRPAQVKVGKQNIEN